MRAVPRCTGDAEVMMDCRSEETIERAAMELFAASVRTPEAIDAAVAEAGDSLNSELIALARHSMTCVRCRELLTMFLATESGLEDALSTSDVSVAESSPAQPRVFELLPVRSEGSSDGLGDLLDSVPYAVAADSPDDGSKEPSVTEAPVVSLASEDGSYLVRIFPKPSGNGATAVLIRGDVVPGDEKLSGKENAEPRFAIQIEGKEYPFDARGVASLPSFPAQAMQIVVR